MPHGNGKVKKFKFLSGVRWFLKTLTLVFLLCVPLSSTHDLLTTFHNALRKQGCPQQGTDSFWTVQIKIVSWGTTNRGVGRVK